MMGQPLWQSAVAGMLKNIIWFESSWLPFGLSKDGPLPPAWQLKLTSLMMILAVFGVKESNPMKINLLCVAQEISGGMSVGKPLYKQQLIVLNPIKNTTRICDASRFSRRSERTSWTDEFCEKRNANNVLWTITFGHVARVELLQQLGFTLQFVELL